MTTPLQRLWYKYAHILTNERKWIGDIWQQRLVAWLTKEMCSALKRALIRIWRAGMQANINLHYSVQCVWRILIISKTLTGIQMQMHTIQYKIATDRSPINTAIGTIRRIRLLLLANIESKYTHTQYTDYTYDQWSVLWQCALLLSPTSTYQLLLAISCTLDRVVQTQYTCFTTWIGERISTSNKHPLKMGKTDPY